MAKAGCEAVPTNEAEMPTTSDRPAEELRVDRVKLKEKKSKGGCKKFLKKQLGRKTSDTLVHIFVVPTPTGDPIALHKA